METIKVFREAPRTTDAPNAKEGWSDSIIFPQDSLQKSAVLETVAMRPNRQGTLNADGDQFAHVSTIAE